MTPYVVVNITCVSIVAGILLWILNEMSTLQKIGSKVRWIINVVVLVLLVLWIVIYAFILK